MLKYTWTSLEPKYIKVLGMTMGEKWILFTRSLEQSTVYCSSHELNWDIHAALCLQKLQLDLVGANLEKWFKVVSKKSASLKCLKRKFSKSPARFKVLHVRWRWCLKVHLPSLYHVRSFMGTGHMHKHAKVIMIPQSMKVTKELEHISRFIWSKSTIPWRIARPKSVEASKNGGFPWKWTKKSKYHLFQIVPKLSK